jgi:Mn-dependent DtxR family transcriptional regulator
MLQWSINLNREIAKKMQYLDDNTQTIAKKLKVQISTVKKEVANAQLVNTAVYEHIQYTKQDNERLKKMGESNLDYATRSQ